MKFLLQKKYSIIIFVSLLILQNISFSQETPNNTFNNQKSLETNKTEFNIKGNGAQCLEKLKNYRQKFSSVKSFILTDSNTKKYLSQNNITLIYIHSACTQESFDFIPIIKSVSEYYYNYKNNSTIIATMDITDDENNINNQYNFRSLYYPIIILKVKGIKGFIPYTGYYNEQSIITFITKFMYKSEVIKLGNDNQSNNLLEQMTNSKYTYMSIFALNNKYINTFKKFSEGVNYVLFGDCTKSDICLKKFGDNIYKYSDFVLVKMTSKISDFENVNINYDSHILSKPLYIPYNYSSYQELKEFIYLNAIPKIFNFTEFNKDLTIASLVYNIIYIKGRDEKKSDSEISKILEKALNLPNNKIKLASILDPIHNQNEESLMNNFRLEYEDYSLYGAVQIQKYEKDSNIIIYRMNLFELNEDKGIKEERLINFVKKFNEGKLNPELRSENRPKIHPKDNLRMIVAKTFDEEITYNYNQAVVLCLLTMNLTDLRKHEDLIDLLTMKLDALNDSLIFGFMDIGYNYMKDMPIYDLSKKPYYRYYYINKSLGYDDFKGNYNNIEEIEEWIAVNFGKENGEEYAEVIRKYIQSVNEQIKEEEEAKRKKEEEFERDVEAGNVTNFEFVLGEGDNEAINVTEQKIQKILKKKMEAEKRKNMEIERKKKMEENYINNTKENNDNINSDL